ncbi:MAG: general secretion pathway protein GspB [Lysobacterales bacterium]
MSILLDALKKSEEQRQLGKTPSIHSPGSEPPDSRRGNQQWIPLALMAVGAIALGWIGWQQYRLPPGLEDGAALAQAQAEHGALDAGGPTGEAEPSADAIVARPPGVSRRTPVEGFEPEAQSPQDGTISPPTGSQAEERPKPRATRSVSTFKTSSAAVQPDETAAASPAAARGTPALAAQDPAPPETPEGQAQPGQSRAEPHVPAPISYWELPQGVRDDLPEMRITVLVYAERPQDRFVLVSGQRMVEKDQFEGGVVLEEIRRDGAVFQFQTYRFLLKG